MDSKIVKLPNLITAYFKRVDEEAGMSINMILRYGLGTFSVRWKYIKVGYLKDENGRKIGVYLSPDREVLFEFKGKLTPPEYLTALREVLGI